MKMKVCVSVCVHTIDRKYIFDLLLYDFQSDFNAIGVRHGVHLIGVQSVYVQDLEKRKRNTISVNIS